MPAIRKLGAAHADLGLPSSAHDKLSEVMGGDGIEIGGGGDVMLSCLVFVVVVAFLFSVFVLFLFLSPLFGSQEDLPNIRTTLVGVLRCTAR